MEMILSVGKFVLEHGPDLVTGMVGVCAGLIVIFSLIPGEQPEKALKAIVGVIEKFSRKPKAE